MAKWWKFLLFNSCNLPPRRLDQSVTIDHVDLDGGGDSEVTMLMMLSWVQGLWKDQQYLTFQLPLPNMTTSNYYYSCAEIQYIKHLVSGEVLVPSVQMSETRFLIRFCDNSQGWRTWHRGLYQPHNSPFPQFRPRGSLSRQMSCKFF